MGLKEDVFPHVMPINYSHAKVVFFLQLNLRAIELLDYFVACRQPGFVFVSPFCLSVK